MTTCAASCSAEASGHTSSFGLSDNTVKMVDNSGADHLGYTPQDSSEPFRAKVEAAKLPVDPKAPSTKYLSGWLCRLGHPDDARDDASAPTGCGSPGSSPAARRRTLNLPS